MNFAEIFEETMRAMVNNDTVKTHELAEIQNKKIAEIHAKKSKDEITLNFDMDGTIANLYAVPNWLPLLRAEDPTPYLEAKPLVNLSALARRLNALQKEGYKLAIISWLSKEPSPTYDKAVTEAKLAWLKRHLPSVHWDRITIVAHGTPKQNYCGNALDVLFDDEEKNRKDWTGRAYDVQNILEILKNL